MADPVVVVLGAGGRVGQELLPMLPPTSRILAVSRTARSADSTSAINWLGLDVTRPGAADATISELTAMTGQILNIIIVDLVLDRTSVTTMRTSLAASTAYTIELAQQIRATEGTTAVVSASTTAVLAPAIYQTPYGRAKRTQLISYTRLPDARVAYLLPQLAADRNPPPTGVTWTYHRAARELANWIDRPEADRCRPRLQLFSPRPNGLRSPPPLVNQVHPLRQLASLQVAAFTTGRDSPAAHRVASQTRLGMTPTPLRRRVDHHLIPARRVGRLARLLHADLTWVDTGLSD